MVCDGWGTGPRGQEPGQKRVRPGRPLAGPSIRPLGGRARTTGLAARDGGSGLGRRGQRWANFPTVRGPHSTLGARAAWYRQDLVRIEEERRLRGDLPCKTRRAAGRLRRGRRARRPCTCSGCFRRRGVNSPHPPPACADREGHGKGRSSGVQRTGALNGRGRVVRLAPKRRRVRGDCAPSSGKRVWRALIRHGDRDSRWDRTKGGET